MNTQSSFCVSFVPLKQLVHIFILIYQTNTNRDNGFDKNCHMMQREAVEEEIFVSVLFSPLSPSLSVGEFKCLIESLYKNNCVRAYLVRGETV